MISILKYLSTWWNDWCYRRQFSVKRQIANIETYILTDMRWLAHSDVIQAILERYETLVKDDWFKQKVIPIDQFREQIHALEQRAFDREFTRRYGVHPSQAAVTPVEADIDSRGSSTAVNTDRRF